MAYEFQTISERDLGNGIDKASAENQIQPGFVEDMVNVEPNSEGYLTKRIGYEGFAGNVPFRVVRYEQSAATGLVCLTLDSSVNLSQIRNTPLVVQGRLSTGSGDFSSTDNKEYYATSSTDIRYTFANGVNLTQSIPAVDHGQGTPFTFVGVASSSSATNFNNSQLLPDAIQFNSASDLTVTYTNSGSAFQGFVYWLGRDTLPGFSWQGSDLGENTSTTIAASGTTSFTVTAAQHILRNNFILTRCFREVGSDWLEVTPDAVSISPAGDVTFTFINGEASPFNVRAVLSSAPDTNFQTGSVAAGQTLTVPITGIEDPFIFAECYLEVGANLEKVLPDSFSVNTVTQQASITFTNNTLDSASFFIYYEPANVSINEICVPAKTVATVTDTSPQLTVWGLEHEGAYGSGALSKAGWVQHIDSYRSEGLNFMVCGLGGNLFEAGTQEDFGTTHLMPTLYPRMTERVADPVTIGPAFAGNIAAASRTRGLLLADGGDEGYLTGQEVALDTLNGWVKYTFNLTNDSLQDAVTIADVISTEDWLTVEQTPYDIHSGTFQVRQVSYSPGLLEIWVQPEAGTQVLSDYDSTGAGFRAGIFTDELEVQSASRFIRGDLLSSVNITGLTLQVVSTSGTTLRVSGVTDFQALPTGLRLLGSRTGRILPLRNAANVATVENVVRGDLLRIGGAASLSRVLDVNTATDVTASISGNIVTVPSTSRLDEGNYVLFAQAGEYDGEFQVTAILDETQFTIDTDLTGTVPSAQLVGNTVELDLPITFTDDTLNRIAAKVERRWIPIEAPERDPADTQVPTTVPVHLTARSYTDQLPLRSVMVQDSLFLTNGEDEVLKYDGYNLTHAGMPPFQLQAFISPNQSGAGITYSGVTANLSAAVAAGSKLQLHPGEAASFTAGNRITVNGDGPFTISHVNTLDNTVTIIGTVTAAQNNSVLEVTPYRYYARINLIDRNENIVISATTGSEDLVVELDSEASVNLKFVLPPAWSELDHARIELEVYRTKAGGIAPYYRIAVLPINFKINDPYVYFTDTLADNLLTELDASRANLTGASLAPGLQIPYRAKYLTSVNNRLVLANLRSYPELSLVFGASAGDVTTANLNTLQVILKKDNTATTTAESDGLNQQRFQFTTAAPIVVTGIDGTLNTSMLVTTGSNHGLTAGDWVYLFNNSTGADAKVAAGWWKVATVPSATTFTVLWSSAPAGAISGITSLSKATSTTTRAIPIYLGTDYNFASPNGNNFLAFTRQNAIYRLSVAINAWSRTLGTAAWVLAQAGGNFEAGQLILSQPKVVNTTFEVEFSATPAFRVFANGTAFTGSAQARELLLSSRLVASFVSYPEQFDSQGVSLASDSFSAVDVNSADGQEITAIVPFFADAAFGAAQQSDILVVFKTNSIYLVDLSVKDAGLDPVRKIESNGLGCTAPYSVTATRQGIMFANETGIYRLTRNLTVDYVGRMIERLWTGRETILEEGDLSLLAGHNWTPGQSYRLSFPLSNETANSHILSYNHSREYSQQGIGGWSRHSNWPAVGWANLNSDAFFASTSGRVFRIRTAGDATDFRDDASAISSEVTLRALDFGLSAARKVVRSIVVHLRVPQDVTATQVAAAVDLRSEFEALDPFKVDIEDFTDGLSDQGKLKIATVKFSTLRNKFTYLQVKLSNSARDEGMEITHIDFVVAGLSPAGLVEAARTTK